MPRSADISPSPLWLTPVAIAAAIVAGNIYGRGPFFLTLAGCALGGAIWVLWRSLHSLTGDAPLSLDEALGLGAPNAEEERKAAVLRALKDLEYERTVGKIDEQDFLELSEKYRAEARSLLQLVDENLGPARREVLASLDERIERELGPQASKAPENTNADNRDADNADAEKSNTDDSSTDEPTKDVAADPTPAPTREQERSNG